MMKKLILVILSVTLAVNCNELQILSSPKSVVFKGASSLPSSSLSEVLAATLGYSVNQPAESWDGLTLNDPFHLAHSVVAVVVEGAETLNFKNSKSFQLVGEDATFEGELLRKVTLHGHNAADLDLIGKVNDIDTAIGVLSPAELKADLSHMKPKNSKNDAEIVNQISYIDGLIDALEKADEKPTALIIRVSLRMLSSKSSSYAEASKLLTSTIEKLNVAVQKLYQNNAVVAVVTVDSHHHHSRSKRQAEEVKPKQADPLNPHNLAELTDKDFPVIFNIVFWFTVILVFTIIAISLALSNVEDKDSIIYRMTGARGKKDN